MIVFRKKARAKTLAILFCRVTNILYYERMC